MWEEHSLGHSRASQGSGTSAGLGTQLQPSSPVLPGPGVLHLGTFSTALMRLCMSNNSSAWSTGQGELKCGHVPGRAGSRAVAQGAAGHPRPALGMGPGEKWSPEKRLSFEL